MHVDVTITPAKDCAIGTEVLWPLQGERVLWVIYSVHDDGLAARSDASKDILVIPRMDFPVPVVVRKRQSNPYHTFHGFGSSTTNTFGSGGGWTTA